LGESLEAALRSLSASGVTAASMRDILDRLQVRLVLTATAMRIATAATCCTIWPW
jgi:phosphoenolpyruvate carboxylase